jgi:hypothetical protein
MPSAITGTDQMQEGAGPSFPQLLDEVVWKLYRARLEDGPSLFFGRVEKGNEEALCLELEALELQLSMPSVWRGLTHKSQHLSCWFSSESWLRHAAWREIVKGYPRWIRKPRAATWKQQGVVLV